ncbi:MAG: hypothetical protein AAFX85_16480 [Pseudomonadota bacterium]
MIRNIKRNRSAVGVAVAAVGVLLVSGCARNIEVPASVPTPVLAALPLTVGVYYEEEFRNFLYIEKLLYGPEINLELGDANVNMFDQMVDSVFSGHVELGEPQAGSAAVDAIIVPTVDEYAFLTPEQAGVDFYSVSIRYKVDLLSPSGNLLDSWTVDSYGRTRATGITGNNSLSQANREALRDATAALALDMQERPSILRLIGSTE